METKLASPIADQPIAFVAGLVTPDRPQAQAARSPVQDETVAGKLLEQPSSPGMLRGQMPIHVDAGCGGRILDLRLRASLSLRTDS